MDIQINVDGITPSKLTNLEDSYDKTLTVRNAIDYIDWLHTKGKIKTNELKSLTLMLNSSDHEDLVLALAIIKNK